MQIVPFLILLALTNSVQAGDSAYTSLKLYEGMWRVTRKDMATGAKPDILTNQCGQLGQFFACAQNVNGAPGGLLIFIPGKEKGRYHTQTIMPEGRATGLDDLEISGDQWNYMSRRRDENGQTTFYRTTNKFIGKNHIHFEQAQSNDGKQWTVQNSGDEIRVSTLSKTTH